MLIWLILFFLVIAVSFVLAFKSMSDYSELPLSSSLKYSLYLVRNPQKLSVDVLNKFYKPLKDKTGLIALETLFKGPKKALVIFGPVDILQGFTNELGLLELEDYSKKLTPQELEHSLPKIAAWEVGLKNSAQKLQTEGKLFPKTPGLLDEEEVWWQVVCHPFTSEGDIVNQAVSKLPGLGTKDASSKIAYQAVLRIVIKASESQRKTQLQEQLSEAGIDLGLTPLPQAFTTAQIVKFYQQRAMPYRKFASSDIDQPLAPLSSEQALSLVG